MITKENILRRCKFRTTDHKYYLVLWETGIRDEYGKYQLGYSLKQDGEILFTGEDYYCSPLHCIDEDGTVKSLMAFLTLKPGDVEEEYFKDYSTEQMAFAQEDAEYLECVIEDRLGMAI